MRMRKSERSRGVEWKCMFGLILKNNKNQQSSICNFALLSLGLIPSHLWCEFIHKCELSGLEVVGYVDFTPMVRTYSQLWSAFSQMGVESSRLGVNFLTTVNCSGLDVGTFILGSNVFMPRVRIFSQLWIALVWKSTSS